MQRKEGGVEGGVGGGDKQRRGNKGLSGLDENSEVGGGRFCEETRGGGGVVRLASGDHPTHRPLPL